MIARNILCIAVALIATTALAHKGVKNEAVKARMASMKSIGTHMKTLGTMAKGEAAFDQAIARSAAASIASHAGETPTLFRAQETDPLSEARPVIWQDFDDFVRLSDELQQAALVQSTAITTLQDVSTALKTLGGTCKSCHQIYRD